MGDLEGFGKGFHSVILATHWDSKWSITQLEEALNKASTSSPKQVFGWVIVTGAARQVNLRSLSIHQYRHDKVEPAKVFGGKTSCSLEVKGEEPVDVKVSDINREHEDRETYDKWAKERDMTLVTAMGPSELICNGKEQWAHVDMAVADKGGEKFTLVQITKMDVPACERSCTQSGNE